ncbi:DUF4229 domain-containing protein [Glutamicibacter sp. MNS18]|uniref:DUF4229 domain-containing protein n=1 Tax=Glutamicibacter sp. MNS18 TaxID=2989817 RepID=UPI0022369043|nr:DUF4229 domain-containing protein [Glutamicibacter sp. MNS18]MCW4464042.1 DUF4229 domain-containing protein [Glutamicibacter sp. MNS18]
MQFLKYTVIRLGIFLIVFFCLWQLMAWPIFLAGLIGLVVAFAVSYLFFNKLRLAAGQDVQKLFARTNSPKSAKQLADEEIEDSFDEEQRKNGQ